MKTIRIDSPFNSTDFIKANQINWIITMKKYKKKLINYSIFSIVILGLGIILITDEEPTNPFIFIGIGFLVLSAFMILIMISSWTVTNKKIKSVAERYEQVKSDYIFELSDDSVKFWDYEKHFDFKWSVFTHYTIFKGYIVLLVNNSLAGSFLFNKDGSPIETYDMILELVKTKLEFKELK